MLNCMRVMKAYFVVIGILVLISGCAASLPKGMMSKVDERKEKATELFIQGKASEAKKDYAEAVVSYLEALKYDPASEDIALSLAKVFIAKGKLLSALSYAELAVKLNPKDSEGWFVLQQIAQYQGDLALAAHCLEMSIKLTGKAEFSDIVKLAWYYMEMGKVEKGKNLILSQIQPLDTPAQEISEVAGFFAKSGLIDDALILYRRLVTQDPLDTDAWVLLGNLLEIKGREQDALDTYRHGLEKNPSNPALLISIGNICMALNNWDCAITTFERAQSAGVDNIKVRKTLCALYFYAGKDSVGFALIDSLKASGNYDATVHFSLGKAMHYLKRYEESLTYFQQGFELIDKSISEDQIVDAYHRLTDSFVQLKREEEALEVIRTRASEHIKDRNNLKLLEASLLSEMKRYDDAIAIYEWLMASDPENSNYIIGLSQLYHRAKQSEKAEKILQRIPKIDPDNIDYLFQLSIIYDTQGKFKKAEKALLDILKKEPDNHLALNNLAYMYLEHNTKLSKALDMAKRALTIRPRNGAYLDTVGWGYYKKGNYREARKYIENALKWEDMTEIGVIYDHYGDVLIKLGLKKEAKDAYYKAIEFGETKEKIQPKLNSIQ